MLWTRQEHASKQNIHKTRHSFVSSSFQLSPSPIHIPNLCWNWGSEDDMMELPLTTVGELGGLAVILTAVASAFAAAAFAILFSKLQLSSVRRRRTLVRPPSFCSSVEEEEEDDASTSSSDTSTGDGDETDEMEERDEEEEESGDLRGGKVKGMGNFSFSSFSLVDLVQGMGVVKAWEGLGLGIDGSRSEIHRSFNGRSDLIITGATLAWPEETDHRRGAVVRVWDGRAGDEAPAATTRSLLGMRIAGDRVR